jgi:multidrug efflux pump subunit AcrB
VNRVIEWFVHHGVAANLLMAVMVVGGLVAIPFIPLKLFPDLDFGIVTIDVLYPGASPVEVEQGVCIPIEEAIQSVVGIENIRGVAGEGACRMWVELYPGTDGNLVATNVRNRVDAIQNFPDEAETPIVAKLDYRTPVIDLAVSGDLSEAERKRIGTRIRDDLTNIDGITQVDLEYTRNYEISIEVSEESLRRLGLRFDDVVAAVRRSSLDLPGGSIKARGSEILLRTKGQAYRSPDFEEMVVVTRPDGSRVLLSEVATIVDGFEETDLAAVFDGKPAVMARAYRVGDEDVLVVSNAVRAYAEQASARLPPGVELTVWQDTSTMIRGRIESLLGNGLTGLLLVFLVLALFLRFRLAIWVALGVPIALLGTFMFMPALGTSIDEATLFAFILVLGILVDDAIVVGESIYGYERRLGDRTAAAIAGAQEMALPVTFGVLTTMAAFAPLLVVPGYMGQMFSFMGLVVIITLIFSLIESQLVLPNHLSHGHAQATNTPRPEARRTIVGRYAVLQARFAAWLERFTAERYLPFLQRAMHWRYSVMAGAISLLMLSIGLLGSGRVAFSFFPPVQAEYVAAQLWMPQGTSAAVTEAGVRRLLDSAEALRREIEGTGDDSEAPVIRHVLASVGRHAFRPQNVRSSVRGAHVGEVAIELAPPEERSWSTHAIARRWAELTGEIAGAKELSFASEFISAGNPIDLQLLGPETISLPEAARFLRERLAAYPGVFDIGDSFQPGKDEIQLSILPEAEPLGLSMQDLARQVRQAFYGEEVQRIQRGRDDVRVMVRYPRQERRSLSDLDNLRIRTPEGAEVPFWSVARARFDTGFADIQRTNRRRVINVTADVDRSRITPGEVMEDLRGTVFPELEARFPGIRISTEGELQDQTKAFEGLVAAYPVALLIIFALLAIPLNSYAQPLIIMSVIPFGLIGAIFGHLLLFSPVSFPSIIGTVALSGVVVNASLVMITTVNRLRDEGRSARQALADAGAIRLRPILLTAMTTFAGLTPLLAETSVQAQILRPMAISLAFGVLFATLITLILVPCIYLALEDFRTRPSTRLLRPMRRSRDAA